MLPKGTFQRTPTFFNKNVKQQCGIRVIYDPNLSRLIVTNCPICFHLQFQYIKKGRVGGVRNGMYQPGCIPRPLLHTTPHPPGLAGPPEVGCMIKLGESKCLDQVDPFPCKSPAPGPRSRGQCQCPCIYSHSYPALTFLWQNILMQANCETML